MTEMVDDVIDQSVTPRTVGQGINKAARVLWMAVAIIAAVPAPGTAQTDPITTAPPNIILPNYNGVPRPLGGVVEGSAYVRGRRTPPRPGSIRQGWKADADFGSAGRAS
jgi:hypothetical protein